MAAESGRSTLQPSMKFKRIMVAVDGSEDSLKAAEVAVKLARAFGSDLIVCHAIPTPVYSFEGSGAASATLLDEYFSSAQKEAKDLLDRVLRLAETEGVHASKLIIDNIFSVVEAIVRNAEASKVDLIIIGTRGRSGFKKLLLGSVSSGVLDHAHCSVLVVR